VITRRIVGILTLVKVAVLMALGDGLDPSCLSSPAIRSLEPWVRVFTYRARPVEFHALLLNTRQEDEDC